MADSVTSPAALEPAAPWVGWSAGIGSTIGFSIAPTVARAAILLGLDPTTLIAVRLAITTLLLGLTIMATSPGRLRMDRRGLLICAAAGLANGVGMLTFFGSLTRIDASMASMLFTVSPLFTLALLALRGERFTYRNTVRLALGVAGVYLLIGPGGMVDPVGVLLVFVSVLTVPFQLVFIQWYLHDRDPRTATLYMVAVMAVVAGGWSLVEGTPWREPGREGWLLIGVLAVVSTYAARLGMFVAVRNIGSGQMSLLTPLETLLTVVWSTWLLGERLGTWQAVGGGLVLLSALLAVQRLGRARWRGLISRVP